MKKLLVLLLCFNMIYLKSDVISLIFKKYEHDNNYALPVIYGENALTTKLNIGNGANNVETGICYGYQSTDYVSTRGAFYFSEDIYYNYLIIESYFDPSKSETYIELEKSPIIGEDHIEFSFLNKTKITPRIYFEIYQYPEQEITNILGNLGLNFLEKTNINNTLISQLKKHDIISSYDFFFKFNDQNTDVELILGALPHEIDSSYEEGKYENINGITGKGWSIIFNDVFSGETKIEDMDEDKFYDTNLRNMKENKDETDLKTALINLEYGIIKAPYVYFKYINRTYFANYPECNYTSEDTLYHGNLHYIICDSKTFDEKIFKDLPKLSFRSAELNYKFEFEGKDLFIKEKKTNNYLFMIMSSAPEKNWIFGTLFYKKYPLYFNLDNKNLKFYNKDKQVEPSDGGMDKKKLVIFICAIVLVVAILVIAAFFIGKYIYKKKKTRANELDDDYDYMEKDGKKTNTID